MHFQGYLHFCANKQTIRVFSTGNIHKHIIQITQIDTFQTYEQKTTEKIAPIRKLCTCTAGKWYINSRLRRTECHTAKFLGWAFLL